MKTPPSKRLDLLITLLGLIGAAVFFGMYDRAFPAAALNLKLSRAEVAEQAEKVLSAYAYNASGYKFALIFSQDQMANIYVQRTLGIAGANERIQREALPIWYWQARWFRPQQQEEFQVQLAPDGQMVGFWHTLEETAAGANLDQAAARQRAEQFLTNGLSIDLTGWESVSASSEVRPNRTDHTFVWKQMNFSLGQSEHRISVTVQGERIGGYNNWLKIPEEFTRNYQEQRSKANLVTALSLLVGMVGFSAVGVLAAVAGIWRRQRVGRSALIAALLSSGIILLARLNVLPLYRNSYATTQNYTQFWIEIGLYSLLTIVSSYFFALFIWEGGDRIARMAWPRQDKILSLEGDRWMNLARSAWRGLMMAGILGGYVVLFYWVTTQFLGAWSPMDVEYSNLFATPLPALSVLESGIEPGIEEEGVFRLIGVSLILWLTRKRWLALLIPGVLFAFAHSSYVRDPFYLRGIEILLPAIFLYGLFFIRFGLVTTVVSHMTYNATLGMLPMLRSGEPYYVFNALLVILALLSPLLIGLIQGWRRRGRAQIEPSIQAARPEDLSSLTALTQGGDWASVLASPDWNVYLLKAGPQVVGAAAGRWNGPQRPADLSFIYVAPGWRERYWGSRLLDALRQRLAERGASQVSTSATASSTALLSFLTGQGFKTEQEHLTSPLSPSNPAWFRKDLPFLPGNIRRRLS